MVLGLSKIFGPEKVAHFFTYKKGIRPKQIPLLFPPCHSPKSSIFWLKFGIKILSQTPTTLDFPAFFQKSNLLHR